MLNAALLAGSLALVPQPNEVKECRALVSKTTDYQLQMNPHWAKSSSGQKLLQVLGELKFKPSQSLGSVRVELERTQDKMDSEAYRLIIHPGLIRIEASTDTGAFYGVQTLAQILRTPGELWPCVSIEDQPRLQWRGMHLDVGRHFHDSATVVRLLDRMAELKLNRFHFHLTDDQGWRMEVPTYPKLTKVGAWRVDRSEEPWNFRRPAKEGEKATYGGFFTTAQLKGIVNEAQKRHIEVIPEIEIPGHAAAALAAYPELSCDSMAQPVPTGQLWPVNRLFCPGRDSTLPFLGQVLRQVASVFPSPWVHLGGDEADLKSWEKDPRTRALQAQLGLKNSAELQGWMLRALADTLKTLGKKSLAWDESLELGDLPDSGAVMAWHGQEAALKAVNLGHPAVLALENELYFDHAQATGPGEPNSIGGYTPLREVFNLQIKPELLASPQLLGMQAQLWTEYIPTQASLDYALFPRIGALAEKAWSPQLDTTDEAYADFLRRLGPLEIHWQKAGIQFERQGLVPQISTMVEASGDLRVLLKPALPENRLYCALGAQVDWAQAKPCPDPWYFKGQDVIQVAAFDEGKRIGKAAQLELTTHFGLGLKPQVSPQGADKFNGPNPQVLVDGRYGSINFGDGRFYAQEGSDLTIEFHLNQAQKMQSLRMGTLQDAASWIFAPLSVEVWDMGASKPKLLGKWNRPEQMTEKTLQRGLIQWASTSLQKITVKVIAQKTCPPGHLGAGGKAWTFIDELELR